VNRAAGFSLIELMVAITISLILSGAVISVFVGSRQSYQSTEGVGDLSDSGRFALDLIGESVRSAGNLACTSTLLTQADTLLPTTFDNNFLQGVTGFEANGTGNPTGAIAVPGTPAVGAANDWSPNLDATISGAAVGVGQPVKGSDVLVLRGNMARTAPVYTTLDVAQGATSVNVSPAPTALQVSQYAAISDCTKYVVFQVTSVGSGAGAAVGLNAGIPWGYSAGALIQPLATTVYYLGVGSDGDSALFRLEQVNGPSLPDFSPPEELVPDIENMQLLYGIAPTGVPAATAYVTADQVGASDNVVSIQVALLVASPPGSKPPQAVPNFNLLGNAATAPTDNRLRKVFFATINLRDAVN
jgi:type IV pilus assembly protein PilW